MSKKNKESQADFETLMAELVQLVESLERGGPLERGGHSLDASLQQFERGKELIELCQKKLQAAEQRVSSWAQKEGKEILIPYENDKLAPEGEGE